VADDWIKMRTNLQRNPRVLRISSALNADRLRVIGGLYAVWSLADEQTEDGLLEAYTFKTIDEMIGWPGFLQALESVKWASETPEGVVFVNFTEHNGKSAKRRAQESDRKRSARESAKPSASNADTHADKKRTREEKRREDKDKPRFALPDWVPADAWRDFEEMRKKKRNELTDRARQLAVAELQRLRDGGSDPRAVIERSVLKGWLSFFAINGTPSVDYTAGAR
jgi:hypothetical protein